MKPKKSARPKRRTKTITREIAGRTLRADVQQEFIADVNQFGTPASALQRAEVSMAAELARDGPVTGETFQFMRGAAGIQAKDLAGLLGVAAETISRWENGARDVDRAAWLVLGGIILERAGKPAALLERMERIAGA